MVHKKEKFGYKNIMAKLLQQLLRSSGAYYLRPILMI